MGGAKSVISVVEGGGDMAWPAVGGSCGGGAGQTGQAERQRFVGRDGAGDARPVAGSVVRFPRGPASRGCGSCVDQSDPGRHGTKERPTSASPRHGLRQINSARLPRSHLSGNVSARLAPGVVKSSRRCPRPIASGGRRARIVSDNGAGHEPSAASSLTGSRLSAATDRGWASNADATVAPASRVPR